MYDGIRLAGMFLCAGGIIFLTFSLTARLRRRVKSVNCFISALYLMRSEIQTHLSDLYDVFGMLAATCPPPQKAFFEAIAVGDSQPGERMRDALVKMRDDLCLGDQEYDALYDLASTIGLYDVESQLRDITRAITRLERARVKAEADCAGRTKLYSTVGISGALIFILIIL